MVTSNGTKVKFVVGDWIKLITLVMVPTMAAGMSWHTMRKDLSLLAETRPTIDAVDKRVEKGTAAAMVLVNQNFTHAAEQMRGMREVQMSIQSNQLQTMRDVSRMAGSMDQISRDVKSMK